MLKKLLIVAFIALPLCVSAQELKFGTVNAQEIFQMMPETTAALGLLQEKNKKYEAELTKMGEELQKKYADYITQRDSLPENIIATREAELADLQQRAETFRQMAADDVQKEQEKLMAPINEKLMQAINEVGTEGNYVYILDEMQIRFKGSMAEDVTPKVKAKLGIQ